jgi:uncharacterized membrane protein YukC
LGWILHKFTVPDKISGKETMDQDKIEQQLKRLEAQLQEIEDERADMGREEYE